MDGSANQLLGVGDCSLEPCEYNKSHSVNQKCKIGKDNFSILHTLLCHFLKGTQYATHL